MYFTGNSKGLWKSWNPLVGGRVNYLFAVISKAKRISCSSKPTFMVS